MSYVSVNTWASHIDMKTAARSCCPTAHNTTTPHLMNPSWLAAHTWHPMSYSPKSGLVYLSAQEQGSIYARAEDGKYKYTPGPRPQQFRAGLRSQPELRRKLNAEAAATEKGYLQAWNPGDADRGLARALSHARLGRRAGDGGQSAHPADDQQGRSPSTAPTMARSSGR